MLEGTVISYIVLPVLTTAQTRCRIWTVTYSQSDSSCVQFCTYIHRYKRDMDVLERVQGRAT